MSKTATKDHDESAILNGVDITAAAKAYLAYFSCLQCFLFFLPEASFSLGHKGDFVRKKYIPNRLAPSLW